MQEGLHIGQYILLKRIGGGGMAEVWEARHVHLGHRVAVKFLLPEYARNQELQERFLNEGKRQAQLQHPNIVPAVDFFQIDGRSFLVMQLVEGRDLEARLQKQESPLSLDEVHAISWDVLSALDHAHVMGIVHRDVKPANMLQDRNGRTLLMDFGIAKALREERSITLTSTSMGTPDYMSPEQILSTKSVDPRSDIYSFGCVLYAMLTGSPPFSSNDATAFHIQDCHVHAAPPPMVYSVPDVPSGVERVVLRCLEKKPADRFQSCREVMAALEAAIFAKPEKAGPGSEAPHPPTQILPASTWPEGKAAEMPVPVAITPQPTTSDPETASDIPVLPPTDQARKSRLGIYLLVGTVAVVIAAALVYLAMRPRMGRRSRLLAKDWSQTSYNDPDFSDCMNVDGCEQRKKLANTLVGEDWRTVQYNSSLLQDCMDFPACLDRKKRAGQILATNWKHSAQAAHTDCMGYQPCLSTKQQPVQTAQTMRSASEPANVDNLPDCCTNSSDPGNCREIKKNQGIQDNCVPLMGPH